MVLANVITCTLACTLAVVGSHVDETFCTAATTADDSILRGAQSLLQARYGVASPGKRWLQTLARRWEFRESPKCRDWLRESRQTMASALIGVSEEPLNQEGFSRVQETCCNFQMEKFMRRLVDDLALEVCDDGSLTGFIPWYTCEKSGAGRFPSFDALQVDLLSGRQSSDVEACGWLAPVGGCKPLTDKCRGKGDFDPDFDPGPCKMEGGTAAPPNPGPEPTPAPLAPEPEGDDDSVTQPPPETTTLETTTTMAGVTCCMNEMGSVFEEPEERGEGPPSNAVSMVMPIDCSIRTLPIQVMPYNGGYAARELSIATGGYSELFAVPFYRTFPKYTKLNGCGIHPDDWIAYCIMELDSAWYIVRMDSDMVEFVAKLKSDIKGEYGAAAFGPSGTFYYITSQAPYTVYTLRGIADMQGTSDQAAATLADVSAVSGSEFSDWGDVADVVAISADLDASGSEAEYLITFIGNKVHVVKADGDAAKYKAWTIPASSNYYNGWGGAWQYNGKAFFANNDGVGVYEIPVGSINLESKQKVTVKRVGESNPALRNDGMNCMDSPVPWSTHCKESYHQVFADDEGECPWGSLPLAGDL